MIELMCNTEFVIFMIMRKTRHLTIRLSGELFNKVADKLIIEKRTKSSLLRDLLSYYIDGNRSGIENQNQCNNKNKKT